MYRSPWKLMMPGHPFLSKLANVRADQQGEGANFDLMTNVWAQPWAVAFMAPIEASTTLASRQSALHCCAMNMKGCFWHQSSVAKIEHSLSSHP